MAATQIASGAGLRHVRAWLIDTSGYPSGDQSGSNGYDGIRLEGVKSFQAALPDTQTIRHTGDDRVFAQDQLPPTEMETATITTGKTNQTVDAVLQGTSIETVGEVKMDAVFTDQAGFEPQVCVYGWRQALKTGAGDAAAGARQYITYIYPSARITPKGGTMAEQSADENQYSVVPTVVTKPPWGKAFTLGSNGFTEATKLRVISDNPLMIERHTGDNSIATFNLQFAPISVAKTTCFVDGVEVTVNSVDVSGKTMTLAAAPGTDAVVVTLYETTDLS